MTPAPTRPEEEDFETINLMLPYIPPRHTDAPRVTIQKKVGEPLIVSLLLKGMKVMKDVMMNVRKLSFVDHDTKSQIDLDHQNYMDNVQDMLEAPK